jgi:hypothetical protein
MKNKQDKDRKRAYGVSLSVEVHGQAVKMAEESGHSVSGFIQSLLVGAWENRWKKITARAKRMAGRQA